MLGLVPGPLYATQRPAARSTPGAEGHSTIRRQFGLEGDPPWDETPPVRPGLTPSQSAHRSFSARVTLNLTSHVNTTYNSVRPMYWTFMAVHWNHVGHCVLWAVDTWLACVEVGLHRPSPGHAPAEVGDTSGRSDMCRASVVHTVACRATHLCVELKCVEAAAYTQHVATAALCEIGLVQLSRGKIEHITESLLTMYTFASTSKAAASESEVYCDCPPRDRVQS